MIYDQMIGMGCAGRLVFSWGGKPGSRLAAPFRDAVESGWPVPLEIEEHSHAGMAAAYAAGAANLPFGVLRGYAGTDLPRAPPRPLGGLPVHGGGAGRGAGACGRTSASSTPSGPIATATCSSGASSACRRRRCSPAALDRHGRGDRGRARSPARRGGAPGVDDQRRVPGAGRRAPSYAQGYYDRDNACYWPGTASVATVTLHCMDAPLRAGDGGRGRIPASGAAAAPHEPTPPRRDHGRGRARRLAAGSTASSASACPARRPTSRGATHEPECC